MRRMPLGNAEKYNMHVKKMRVMMMTQKKDCEIK